MKYKIYLRYQKVSKNTMIPFIDIELNNEIIASAEVSTYKSISAKSIPVNTSLSTIIKNKSQLIEALGDYTFRRSFFPIKKNFRHEDYNMYISYITAFDYINDPDDPYYDYWKDEIKKFSSAYPEFVYCDVRKRHVMKKKRKFFFKTRKIQVGPDEAIKKGIEFFNNMK